jgi:hypothetical protein
MDQGISVGSDDAVVFVHALNPYGMAWLRRVNENNIDLNRNFMEFEKGPSLYQSWLADRLKSLRRGFAIDAHTGLGRSGQESFFLRRSSTNTVTPADILGRPHFLKAAENHVGYDIHGGYSNCYSVLPKSSVPIHLFRSFMHSAKRIGRITKWMTAVFIPLKAVSRRYSRLLQPSGVKKY